jgi:hypothetical protein
MRGKLPDGIAELVEGDIVPVSGLEPRKLPFVQEGNFDRIDHSTLG